MSPFFGEFIGTALLIIMGAGVVANVVLNKTKGQTADGSSSLLVGDGCFCRRICFHPLGGSGHLNPAVTIALAAFGDFDSSLLAPYIVAQFAGAFTGAVLYGLLINNILMPLLIKI